MCYTILIDIDFKLTVKLILIFISDPVGNKEVKNASDSRNRVFRVIE